MKVFMSKSVLIDIFMALDANLAQLCSYFGKVLLCLLLSLFLWSYGKEEGNSGESLLIFEPCVSAPSEAPPLKSMPIAKATPLITKTPFSPLHFLLLLIGWNTHLVADWLK